MLRLRLGAAPPGAIRSATFDAIIDRRVEARPTSSTSDVTPGTLSEDERRVIRQALAGMLWSKQYYCFDVDTLAERARRASA